MRLSAFLAAKNNYSRKFIKTLIKERRITLNGRVVTADVEADEAGDYVLALVIPDLNFSLEKYLLRHEKDVVFLYKPASMHTDRHKPTDPLCLEDILSKSFPEYRLISRLDYPVDGVATAIRGEPIISQQKEYLAWVEGEFPPKIKEKWDVDAEKRIQVKAFRSDSGIEMYFYRLAYRQGRSLVRITLEKAHRHQVRAVCAELGHPIEGDRLYNGEHYTGEISRILLHCSQVSINGTHCDSPHAEAFKAAFT